MAKKKKPTASGEPKVNKSAAIREYLAGSPDAKPKEIVAALKEKGIEVSPAMASLVKAKAKVKSAKRRARKAKAGQEAGAAATASHAGGLDAALTLYKAARKEDVSGAKVRQAFLTLVDMLG